jgi:hypothetical protein
MPNWLRTASATQAGLPLMRLTTIREKLEGLSVWEIAAEVALRARRKTATAYSGLAANPQSCRLSDDDLKRSLNTRSVGAAGRQIREGDRAHLTAGLEHLMETAAVFNRLFPEAADQIKQEAESIISHQLPLFGRWFNLGYRIDWHADPTTNVRWPLVHFSRVPIRLQPGSDVRVVWELNRLHHFVTLGQAYALTGDERYAEEFVSQIASWDEANPPQFGVNWTVAMEAGIRAVNLIAALDLFRNSPLLNDDAIAMMLKVLVSHGRFIRANLEFSYRVTSNHYLSDLMGLFAIGSTLPMIEESKGWIEFSTGELLGEMIKQVHADGVDYEGSIGYHRFVLEIFTLFLSLAGRTGVELPRTHRERVKSMFDFVRHYLKPDGNAPSIGDSDDGRLLRFKSRRALDHAYLTSIGAILLGKSELKGSAYIDEEAVWWFGEKGVGEFEQLAVNHDALGSRGFGYAQIYVQRDGPLYAILDCGDHGALGRGSHAHSDALSIELYAFDQTFLRDPGTFVYTADEAARNLFRSTAYHNTVRVDGLDISAVRAGQTFSLGPNVRPEINRWESTEAQDVLEATHRSYTRLAEPVVHRRVVTFDKAEGSWTITDLFSGSGTHLLEYFFNLEPGLDVSFGAGRRAILDGRNSALAIIPSNFAPEAEIVDRWVSSAYGTRTASSAIIFRLKTVMPFESTFLLIPSRR